MSEIVERLKAYYKAAKNNNIKWYDYYPNNMPCNHKEGIYTYFWFKNNDKWNFLKYTIEYMSRVDAEGITHTEEGVKYYVLHSYQKEYDNIMTIPEPSDDDGMLLNDDTDTEFSPDIVNDFGRFRYVFDDEETAKAVISSELLARIYPYLFILSKEELEEWKYFVDAFEK